MSDTVNVEALKSEIRSAAINHKVNACPILVRLAWHASGTYDKNDKSGGSNGATMRFEPESSDPANAGLHVVRNILKPVKANHPELTNADLWISAGAAALEFIGGPKISVHLGRKDCSDASACPANGRLPDAAQGAYHLRAVFGRMGFNDREIVALSGAHTLGRCHLERSGYDGPWTRNPLKFDNTFYKNLLYMEWKKKDWDGPLQFEDVETGELMMLPTDMALRTDPGFRVFAEMYAKDQDLFFKDFAAAFSKLLNLGVTPTKVQQTERDIVSAEFREAAMHGSLSVVKAKSKHADVHAVEKSSGRNALHHAAFWGHTSTVKFLINECKLDLNVRDCHGDTALHDAVKYDHPAVVKVLVESKADVSVKNKDGKDVLGVAVEFGNQGVVAILKGLSKL